MSLWFSYPVRRELCGVLCLLLAGQYASLGQQEGSAPKPAENTRSVKPQAKAPVNRLLLLEERLTRALKGLAGETSLNSVPPRPSLPAVRQTPQVRKPAEENIGKHDWMLMDPDDFAEHEASLELRKMLKDSGLLKDPNLSKEEQWLRDFNQPGFGTKGIIDSANDRDLQRDSQQGEKDRSTPAEIARKEENLRSMLQDKQAWGLSGLGMRQESHSSLADMFRPPEELSFGREKEGSYVEDYRKLMTPAPLPANDFASSALGAIATDGLRATRSVSTLDAMQGSKANILGPQFGSINPVLTPQAPLDTSDQVLNQWNKYYTPPSLPERPRSYAPPKPTFEPPRRQF